jgi:hypothetical protein
MSSSSNQPNFFIVGAAKAGTTSLYHYLAQHPDVYMSPIKEPNFFATDIDHEAIRPQVKDRIRLLNIDEFLKGSMSKGIHRAFISKPSDYFALFRFADGKKAIGEASASYLFSQTAAQEIYKYNPEAKIIILLRNPVQRMYSHYLMDKRMTVTTLSFEDAIEEDKKTKVRKWAAASLYLELGEYYQQVKRFKELFPEKNVLVLLSEELKSNPVETIRQVYKFLNIDEHFQPDFTREFNTAVVARNSLLQKIISINYLRVKIRRLFKNTGLKKHIKQAVFTKPEEAQMPIETKIKYTEYYKSDILKLSELIQKDLHKWIQ